MGCLRSFVVSIVGMVCVGAATALVSASPAAAGGVSTWLTANSVSTGDQDAPAVATNRNGDVAVVWEDDRDTTNAVDNTHSEVFLRLFRRGVSAYEIKLSPAGTTGVNWKHITPDVGLDDRGNAVVVWADDPDGNGFYNIPYRVVSPAGTVTASGYANASADGQQIAPKVSVDPDGVPASPTAVAFTVVWEDIVGTAQPVVKASGYTSATTKAYEATVSPTTGSHHRPDVAVSASGEALVVWDDDSDANNSYDIGLTRLARTNGAAVLSRRVANSVSAGQQWHASVAATFNGDFVIAWESDQTGTPQIWARSFLANATARHAEIQVSVDASPGSPSVGIDDQANMVVGWTVSSSDPAVWVAGFNPGGTATSRLPAQSIGQFTVGRQEQIAVGVSAWGEVVVAYTDDNDANTFDQVLLGLGATNSA
jgi:hypothetical protein